MKLLRYYFKLKSLFKRPVDRLEPTFKAIGKSYAKDNDAKALMQQVKETLDIYRTSDLPKTREEFEARARLFRFYN
jgi:uncharacterized membrane protein YgaE (UPF0421/DUF939 family)